MKTINSPPVPKSEVIAQSQYEVQSQHKSQIQPQSSSRRSVAIKIEFNEDRNIFVIKSGDESRTVSANYFKKVLGIPFEPMPVTRPIPRSAILDDETDFSEPAF